MTLPRHPQCWVCHASAAPPGSKIAAVLGGGHVTDEFHAHLHTTLDAHHDTPPASPVALFTEESFALVDRMRAALDVPITVPVDGPLRVDLAEDAYPNPVADRHPGQRRWLGTFGPPQITTLPDLDAPIPTLPETVLALPEADRRAILDAATWLVRWAHTHTEQTGRQSFPEAYTWHRHTDKPRVAHTYTGAENAYAHAYTCLTSDFAAMLGLREPTADEDT